MAFGFSWQCREKPRTKPPHGSFAPGTRERDRDDSLLNQRAKSSEANRSNHTLILSRHNARRAQLAIDKCNSPVIGNKP
jgi:hypothetical protein